MTRTIGLAERKTGTVTIAASASLSGALDLGARTPVGIILPSGWTTASLTFQGSVDGSTFFDLYNAAGVEVTVTNGQASRWYALDPSDFYGVRYLKIRSGSSGTPVNQTSQVTVTVVVASV
jgi:hypothetical protein